MTTTIEYACGCKGCYRRPMVGTRRATVRAFRVRSLDWLDFELYGSSDHFEVYHEDGRLLAHEATKEAARASAFAALRDATRGVEDCGARHDIAGNQLTPVLP